MLYKSNSKKAQADPRIWIGGFFTIILFLSVVGLLVSFFHQFNCDQEIQNERNCQNQLSKANQDYQQLATQLNKSQEEYLRLTRENITKADIEQILLVLNQTTTNVLYLHNEVQTLNTYVSQTVNELIIDRRIMYSINVTLVIVLMWEFLLTLFKPEFTISRLVINLFKRKNKEPKTESSQQDKIDTKEKTEAQSKKK